MKGRPIPYSSDELAWLADNYTLPVSHYAARFNELFGRDIEPKHLHALRKRKGWKTGRTGQFEKGAEPHNRGKPCAPGTGGLHPNSRKTQFRKGNRSGIAVKRHKPVGTERISKDGYRERKVHDGLPMQSRWRAVHLIEWEKVNGPLPKGHALKCLDGNRLNTDASNWTLISRAMLPYLNGHRGLDYGAAEPEARPVILTIAKLKHAVRERRREAAE